MSEPRVVVVEFANAQRIRSWREHCDDALGISAADRPLAHASDRFVWQLTSGNNRAVARGYRTLTSADAALEDFAAVRDRGDQLAIRSIRTSHLPAYSWAATLGEEVVMMSARVYSTVRDMRDSIALARGTLAAATVRSFRRATETGPVPIGRAM
jgi:hypothetical protein